MLVHPRLCEPVLATLFRKILPVEWAGGSVADLALYRPLRCRHLLIIANIAAATRHATRADLAI